MISDSKLENISSLSNEEKKEYLFLKQKKVLDAFLERSAISKEQYSKSLGDLADKMEIDREKYNIKNC